MPPVSREALPGAPNDLIGLRLQVFELLAAAHKSIRLRVAVELFDKACP